MANSALTPVFVGLRTGLHALFFVLTALVIARALLDPTDVSVPVVLLAVTLGLTYASGAFLGRSLRVPGAVRLCWLAVLTAEWVLRKRKQMV